MERMRDMKTIGLIGGLSWQSTVDYYRIINEESAKRLGGLNNVKTIVYSVNLAEMLGHMERGETQIAAEKFAAVGKTLEGAGAEVLILCTNTMHAVCHKLEESLSIPFVHITDATGAAIQKQGIKKIGLIGTPFTMGQDFLKGRLERSFGLTVLTPPESCYDAIFRVITEELTFGILKEESRRYYLQVMEELRSRGAEGIILGCTEIPMLIKQSDTDLPVFDTTTLHALAAVEAAEK